MEKAIKRVFVTLLEAAGVCLVWLFVGPCPSTHTSVCAVCGIRAGINEIRFGFTSIRINQEFRFETNAVSAALLQDPTLAGHTYEWLFAYGGPPGVCAIGPGRHLTIPLRDTNAAAFVSHLFTAGDKTRLNTWRRRLLDPKQTEAARGAMFIAAEDRMAAETWVDVAERRFAELSAGTR